MNGTSAPIVSGNKEGQELKTYSITVAGRFYQYFDIKAVDEEQAKVLAEREIDPACWNDWDYFELEVEEEDEGEE